MTRPRIPAIVLVAVTVGGVSLPHLAAGGPGSMQAAILGIVVGLGCLRLAMATRSPVRRGIATLGPVVATLAPLLAFMAQEAAERSGIERMHGEPDPLSLLFTQAPLLILALLAARLVLRAVGTVVRVLARPARQLAPPRRSRLVTLPDQSSSPLRRVEGMRAHGPRAPPLPGMDRRLVPLG